MFLLWHQTLNASIIMAIQSFWIWFCKLLGLGLIRIDDSSIIWRWNYLFAKSIFPHILQWCIYFTLVTRYCLRLYVQKSHIQWFEIVVFQRKTYTNLKKFACVQYLYWLFLIFLDDINYKMTQLFTTIL